MPYNKTNKYQGQWSGVRNAVGRFMFATGQQLSVIPRGTKIVFLSLQVLCHGNNVTFLWKHNLTFVYDLGDVAAAGGRCLCFCTQTVCDNPLIKCSSFCLLHTDLKNHDGMILLLWRLFNHWSQVIVIVLFFCLFVEQKGSFGL